MQSISEILAIARHRSLTTLARDLVTRLMPYQFCAYRRDLSVGIPAHPVPADAVIEAPGIEALVAWRSTQEQLPLPFDRDKISKVDTFLWAKIDARVVGIVWWKAGGQMIRLDAQEGEIFDVLTLPEFRGRGLAKALVEAACRELRRHQIQRAYAAIRPDNAPSRRAFEAVNFQLIGTFTYRWPFRAKIH